MARKSGLGRGAGINAIIPEITDINEKDVSELDIDLIFPNKDQPRKNFDREKLESLSESIKEHGLVQPLVVVKDGDYYKIVAGERRWRACKNIGLKKVPAVVRDYSDMQVAEIALVENLQREDLNPIEEANGYLKLIEEFSLTQEQVSEKVKKSRVAVTNALRLLNLPSSVIKMVEEGKISKGHAKALLGLKNEEDIIDAAEVVRNKEFSVRQTEDMVKNFGKKPVKKRENIINKDVVLAIDTERKKLENKFSAKVNVSYSPHFKGKIEINFSDYREMNRLFEILGKQGEK